VSHRSTAWMERRACAGADPAIFTPATVTAGELDQVRHDHCGRCPVREECLAYGMEGAESGIWGGQFLIRGAPKRQARPGPGQGAGQGVTHQRSAGHVRAARAQGAEAALHAWHLLRKARPFIEGQLSQEQKQALELRLRHPRLDASRLAEMAYPPVSRHAMNGRLRRLGKTAQAALDVLDAPAQTRVEAY
jgi:Transcription factor WhiB/WhiA C-terminal HTH domain